MIDKVLVLFWASWYILNARFPLERNSSEIIWTKAYSNHKFCLELFMCVMMSWPKLYYYFWLEGRCYEFLWLYVIDMRVIYFWFEVYWQMTRYVQCYGLVLISRTCSEICVDKKMFLSYFVFGPSSSRNEVEPLKWNFRSILFP